MPSLRGGIPEGFVPVWDVPRAGKGINESAFTSNIVMERANVMAPKALVRSGR